MELQSLIGILNQKKKDYKGDFQRFIRHERGQLTEEEAQQLQREEQIMQEKFKQAEKTKIYVQMLNKGAQRLMEKSNIIILINEQLQVGSYVSLQQEHLRGVEIFQRIHKKQKFSLNKPMRMPRMNAQMTEEQRAQNNKINSRIYELAKLGNAKAMYTYGKESFLEVHQQKLYSKNLQHAADHGIHSANLYLGHMYEDGIHVKKDTEKALDCYIKGAAKNNAFCFFHLSRIYQEGKIVEVNPKLQFIYLKRAAEEGFVRAQHFLGIEYHKGVLTKRDDYLSLAWFREAIRNGYPPAYQLAGDLLYSGGVNLQPNKLFALVHYLGAYNKGALFLKEKLEELTQELKNEGESIPDFSFLDFQDIQKDMMSRK